MLDKHKELNNRLKKLLSEKDPVITPFPPCTDILLSLMGKIWFDQANNSTASKDMTIANIFQEYFTMKKHKIFSDEEWSSQYAKLFTCGETRGEFPSQDVLDDCLPPTCKTLEGNRRLSDYSPQPRGIAGIRRLFTGDLVWLFFMENIGIFKMLRYILRDYEFFGWYPISNNSLISVVMEVMIRETRKGLSSTLTDRYFVYSKGITVTPHIMYDSGFMPYEPYREYTAKLQGLTEVFLPTINASPVPFNVEHPYTNSNDLCLVLGSLIKTVLSYYRDRKMTNAIQSQIDHDTPVNLSSIVSIISIIDNLKTKFMAFNFGRIYYNTLNAIIWLMAGLSLIWELRTSLGISYQDFYQFLSASYDIVSEGASSSTGSNSIYFKLNHDCANAIRSILLDLEVLDLTNMSEVETWLDLVENKFESFRAAYFQLTGNDLAITGRLWDAWIGTDPHSIAFHKFERAPESAFPGEIVWPFLYSFGTPRVSESLTKTVKSTAHLLQPPSVHAQALRTQIANLSPYLSEKPESIKELASLKQSPQAYGSSESASAKYNPPEHRSVKLQSDKTQE